MYEGVVDMYSEEALKSDLRGIEISSLKTRWWRYNRLLKSDLRGIEIHQKHEEMNHRHVLKSDLRGIEIRLKPLEL